MTFFVNSRFNSEEPSCLPPAAGIFATFPGLSPVLSAYSNPKENMGEGPS